MWKKTKFSKNFSDIIRHLESKYEGKLLGDKVGKEEKKTNESELILSEEKIGYKIEVGLGEGIKIDLNLDLRFFKVW